MATADTTLATQSPTDTPLDAWSYEEAFSRNLGLINPEEQDRLRNSRVAIVGMGGVGGIHLATLARLGVGAFHIADFDTFEVANFNRQYGAEVGTIGQNKVQVMAERALAINPDLDLRVFSEAIAPDNVADFLAGVDVLVDGIDFFSTEARRLVFREARERGIWAVTAGPIGFSTAWLVFSPTGMSFDRYFDLSDEIGDLEKLVAFGVGLAPKATQRTYMDLNQLDITARTGPSTSTACLLAGGVVGCEAVKILLGKVPVRAAPYYQQFDPFLGRLARGRLPGGNRHPLQRLKRWWLVRHLSTRAKNSD